MYAHVIVDIAHSSVDRVFEYRVPEGMELTLGQRVLAPFGRGNGVTEGYVVTLSLDCTYDPQRGQGDPPEGRSLSGLYR